MVKFMFSKKATKIDKIFKVALKPFIKRQINGEDFLEFCGLLRKHKLYLFLLAFPAVIELHQFWRFFQFGSGRSAKAATNRPRACRSIEGHILLYLKINKKIFFKLFEKGVQKGQKKPKQRQGPQKGPIWINWNGCQKYTQTWSIEWNILLDPRKKA